ncbi:ALF repeat-containing protein, partial [Streptomyces sp. NPDC058964]|uniref:ALF repeat-containing protein n=1 Tax=Streptomyces sp. NPDC058964 TaxID=3346681 RepID=UPI0036B59D40
MAAGTRHAIRALCLGLLPSALLLGLLGTAPAPAHADPAPTDTIGISTTLPDTDRAKVVRLWEAGGPGVKAAAEVALVGGDDDVRKFLDQASDLQFQDNRVAAAQVAGLGGLNLQEAARKALDSSSPDDLKTFLQDGWQAPLEQDQRVRVAQIIDAGGPEVQKAGRVALDGTPDDIRNFLANGQFDTRAQDERVEVAQIISVGGTNVQTAGRLALNGTADDIYEFLQIGQYVARSHDQEHATIAQLAEQAQRAGKLARKQTEAAKEASKRAVTAATRAKAAALK